MSAVLPVWGVMMTLSRHHNGWPSTRGSGSVTSSPAPPTWPESSADSRSAVTTCAPRPTLITSAPGARRPSRSAFTTPIVDGVSGHATTTTSAPVTAASSSDAEYVRSAPSTARPDVLTTAVAQLNGRNKRRSDCAIPPPPITVTDVRWRVRPSRALQ